MTTKELQQEKDAMRQDMLEELCARAKCTPHFYTGNTIEIKSKDREFIISYKGHDSIKQKHCNNLQELTNWLANFYRKI